MTTFNATPNIAGQTVMRLLEFSRIPLPVGTEGG